MIIEKAARLSRLGFTLIEILVVMVIISIVSGASLLMIGHNKNTHMEMLAKEIANLLTLAEAEATLKPAVLGFGYTTSSFQFYEWNADIKPPGNAWQKSTQPTLGEHKFSSDIQLSLKIHGKTIPTENDLNKIEPALIISSSGDITPFTLFIGAKNEKPVYQVVGLGNGKIYSAAIATD